MPETKAGSTRPMRIHYPRIAHDIEYRKEVAFAPLTPEKREQAQRTNRKGFCPEFPGELRERQQECLEALGRASAPLSQQDLAVAVNYSSGTASTPIGRQCGKEFDFEREQCDRVTGVVSLVTRGYAEIVRDNISLDGRFGYVITQKGLEFLRGSTTTESPPFAAASSDSDSSFDTAVVQEEEYWEPEACDIVAPPDRVECTTTRIIRSSALALEVKQRHNFECQICGTTIELPHGDRYAEAHHIQPLGGEHRGVDTIENMLCLCPNHHAELDLGAREIELDSLRSAPGHNVDPEFVGYHNSHIALLR